MTSDSIYVETHRVRFFTLKQKVIFHKKKLQAKKELLMGLLLQSLLVRVPKRILGLELFQV